MRAESWKAGSHLVVVGSQHELLMEQDRYRTSAAQPVVQLCMC